MTLEKSRWYDQQQLGASFDMNKLAPPRLICKLNTYPSSCCMD